MNHSKEKSPRVLSDLPRSALTLIEMLIVLVIMVGLASVLVPLLGETLDRSSKTITRASMIRVRDAIMQYWADTKFMTLDGTVASDTDTTALTNTNNRFQVRWLFEAPTNDPDDLYKVTTRLGWNGPYLTQQTGIYDVDDEDGTHTDGTNFSALYGNDGGPAILGAVSTLGDTPRPLVVQAIFNDDGLVDCRIVSAGPNDRIDIPHDMETSSVTKEVWVDDDFVAFTLRR